MLGRDAPVRHRRVESRARDYYRMKSHTGSTFFCAASQMTTRSIARRATRYTGRPGRALMSASATESNLKEILPWRDLYRQEMSCQITKDSIHFRDGWTKE